MNAGRQSILTKKGLAVGIILVFIGLAFAPSITASITKKSEEQVTILTGNGNTLYVGGDGPGNYTRIQDAIDNSTNGDTVFVFNGTYHEYIDILNKSINVVGENRNSTIIHMNKHGSVVYIRKSHNCIFSGFTLLNNYNEYHDYVSLVRFQASPENTLSDCILSFEHTEYMYHNADAIYLSSSSSNNIITNNHLIEIEQIKDYMGINIQSLSNDIYDNTISGYYHGIHVESKINNISRNHITQNIWGIYLNGDNNKISKNDIVHNSWYGLYVNKGGHRISENNISYNGLTHGYYDMGGIKIWYDTDGCIIEKNIISHNLHSGIYLCNPIDNYIMRNNFIDNGDNVIFTAYPLILKDLISNKYIRNYWSDYSGIGPKFIRGHMSFLWYSIPCFYVEFLPKRNPYDY